MHQRAYILPPRRTISNLQNSNVRDYVIIPTNLVEDLCYLSLKLIQCTFEVLSELDITEFISPSGSIKLIKAIKFLCRLVRSSMNFEQCKILKYCKYLVDQHENYNYCKTFENYVFFR